MKKIIDKMKDFMIEEDGNESVELAILFPIILLIVGFIIDRFIQYEGVTAISAAANEAIRYSVVAEGPAEAESVIKETLADRLKSSKLGWCSGDNNACTQWATSIKKVNDRGAFEGNKSNQLYIRIDEKGWCNGSYIEVGVRAHKSSILPSYESFMNLIRNGGPIYHSHKYIVTARIESNTKCEE